MFTSLVTSDSSGAATATMMVASRRLDLNLNHAPPAAYEEPVREGLKQAMIQHEIVFKNQVRELHRLYSTQKNLMNEVYWGRSDRVSVHRGSEDGEEERAGDAGRMRMRDFDLQLPAEEFIEDAADEFANEFMQGNSSSSNGCAFSVGHMNLDLNTVQDGETSSLVDVSANMHHSALSDLYLVSRIPHESGYMSKEYSHQKHQAERWQENPIHSKVGLEEYGASLSANSSPYEKIHTQPKLMMDIDLNIAQDDEPVDISTDNAETNLSPSTSSSVVLDGDNLRVPETVNRNAANIVQPGAVSLGSENSREKCADSLPCKSRASNQICDVIENGWSHRDNEVCRSKCHKSLTERLSGDHNRETRYSNANGAVLDFLEPGKETAESLVCRDSRKNVSDSSNCLQHDPLHESAGNTKRPQNLSVGLEEQPMHNRRSEEEDTVSSHAIDPDEEQQQDELKESPATGIELSRLSEDGECTSKAKRVSERAVISNSENSGTTHAGSVSPEQHKEQNVEQDNFIVKAAETLVSILSDNLSRSLDGSKLNSDEGNDHPQISDSFEAQTLTLQEEVGDNATSAVAGRTADDTREENVRRIQLRRGRRLRDFQKDILPGMVSLSRQEICEDLYAIKYELRKIRSRRTCEKNWSVPVRSRRARLGVSRRR